MDERIEIYTSIAIYYAEKEDYSTANQWIDSANYNATNPIIIARNYRLKGQIMVQMNNYDGAREAVTAAFSYGQNCLPDREAALLNNLLGSVYAFTGHYRLAFDHYYEGMTIAHRSNDNMCICTSTLNLGVAHYKASDYDMAVSYFEQYRNFCLPQYGFFALHSNLALAHSFAGNPKKALDYLQESKNRFKKPSPRMLIDRDYAYGVVFEQLGQIDSAEFYYKQSLTNAIQEKNSRFIAENSLSLGQIYLRKNNPKIASTLFTSAEKISIENNYENILVKIFEMQAIAARNASTILSVIHTQNKVILKRNDLYSSELALVLGRVKSRELEKKYQQAVRHQKSILEHQQALAHNEKVLKYTLLAAILLVTLLLILVISSYRINSSYRSKIERIIQQRTSSAHARILDIANLNSLKGRRVAQTRPSLKSYINVS